MVAEINECDRHRLEQLLADELSMAQAEETHRHLESCVTCRAELESLAAEQQVWTEMPRYLQRDESDPALPLSQATRSVFGSAVVLPAIETVLERLAESENPAMLGRLGEYDVLEVVGAGGMGVVLKGYDRQLNRFVAIKVLAPHYASNAAARTRFAREAKAAAAVVHPHVVSIHGVADSASLPYFIMQYVPGQSLQQRIDSDAPMDIKDVLRIGAQTAQGLAAAHAQGLVHRDIKPANILLENGVERVLISDFGLARAADDASMTQSGVIAGTPQFMSPEQARGEPIDARSDLFSLGSVLYATCTGHSPFRAETTMGVLSRIYNEPPRPLRNVNSDVPDFLAGILDRLLAKDPADRFQTADEAADCFGGWLAHVQQPDVVPRPAWPASQNTLADRFPPSRFRRVLLAAGGGLLFILATILIVLELNKGTLEIHCDANIPVRIMKGVDVYDRVTITPTNNRVRIAAGQYVVQLDGEFENLEVENGGDVTVPKRDTKSVRIIRRQPSVAPKTGEATGIDVRQRAPAAASEEVAADATGQQPIDVDEPVFQGKTLAVWLSELQSGAEVQTVINAIDALGVDAPPHRIKPAVDRWAAMVNRERDPSLLAEQILVLCALSGEEYTPQALDAIVTAIGRQPERGSLSIYEPRYEQGSDLLGSARYALRRLDEQAVRAHMAKEVEHGNSQTRHFALAFCDTETAVEFATGPVPLVALLAAATDKVYIVRRRAIGKLARIYPEDYMTRTLLHNAFDDETGVIATDVAVYLSRIDPNYEKLLPRLVTSAKSGNSLVQVMATMSLLNAAPKNPEALKALSALLKEPRWGHEVSYLDDQRHYSRVWDQMVLPTAHHEIILRYGVQQKQQYARRTAVLGLGKLIALNEDSLPGNAREDAMEILRSHLKHGNKELRFAAAQAIQVITGEEINVQ